jgi:predicted deacylase
VLATILFTAAAVSGLVAVGRVHDRMRNGLASGPYPSPDEAEREVDSLAAAHPSLCSIEEIGRSTEGRAVRVIRIAARKGDARPRLLVTANIHAVEYVGSYVARGVLRRLLEGHGREPAITALLDAADVFVAPLMNPDGAARVWRQHGRSGLARARHTATGVDPNRNFPGVAVPGRRAWNTARTRPGSAYYRGPHPLSEPECAALARLCARERFCAAVNFHSFGRVIFIPEVIGGEKEVAERALEVFHGVFQSRQRLHRYKPVPDAAAKTSGQLDPFLLHGLGIPSVTVEVGRPSPSVLLPWRILNVFWWANPSQPARDRGNDVEATVHALAELLARTEGRPCKPAHPELAGGMERPWEPPRARR